MVRPFPAPLRHVSSYEKDVTPMEGEKPKVNLYDGHYSDHMKEAQTKVRTYTYGDNGNAQPLSALQRVAIILLFAKLVMIAVMLH